MWRISVVLLYIILQAIFTNGDMNPDVLATMTSCSFNMRTFASSGSYSDKMTKAQYDYIIVGGGTAGSVIASRLSEDPNVNVLLLEAGGLPPEMAEIPLFAPSLLTTGIDKIYLTEPQKNACFGLPGNQTFADQAITLGGCSTHNYMIYNRGCHQVFDDWAAMGATGWDWENVKPFFMKAENMTVPELAADGYHGVGGPISITFPSYTDPLLENSFVEGRNLGYKDNADYNGESQFGQSRVQYAIRDGLRSGVEKEYLRKVGCRPNLDIVLNATVVKVQFDTDNTARSVIYEKSNVSYTAVSKGEIIMSAGVINTPKILMLSGVGPKEDLEKLNIKVISDLPVGKNLHDHIVIGGLNYFLNDTVTLVYSRDVTFQAILDLIFKGTGPLTSVAGIGYILFLSSQAQDPKANCPDITLYILTTALFTVKVEDKDKDKNIITVAPTLCYPRSRGYVKLRTTDPRDDPIFDPQYLSDNTDVLTLVEAVERGQNFVKQPLFQQYAPQRFPETIPGCEGMNEDTVEFRTCLVKSLTNALFHLAGTCRMGDPKNETTVVDPQLRVLGVKGLRVADGSIMPKVSSGNTGATCIMIGEKAADIIKKTSGSS